MKQRSGKLGFRELVSIAFLMIGSKGTDNTPTVLVRHVQNAAWMIPILSGLLFVIPLYLLLKTMSLHKDKNLFEAIQQIFGKYLGFVVCLLIFLINSYAISFDSRAYANIISALYLTTTPELVIYATLMFICAYGAKKGIQHIGSVSYLVIYYVIFSFYLAFFLSTQDSSIQSIFPIWGPGKVEILKESVFGISLFGELFILAAILPYVQSFKTYRKATWVVLFCIMVQLSLAILLFICLFDKGLVETGFPFHATIRYISLGQFLTNVETLFFPIWLMSAFIRFAAFFYINALMLGYLFKIKKFEYLIPTLTAIYLLFGMIPESATDVAFVRYKAYYLAGPLFAFISILLWMTAWLKGEFKHAKKKSNS